MRGVLPCVFLAMTAGAALAQAVNVQDRAQLLGNQSPFATDPYAADVNGVDQTHRAVTTPNDPDIGEQEILKRIERYQPFIASVAMPFYYTSNVALVRRGEKGDFVLAPVAGFTYAPRITQTFFGEITVQDQQFYYNKYDVFDFGSFDIRVGGTYLLPQVHNLILRAQYDYNRLNSRDSFDSFFEDHSIFFSAELPFRFGRAQQLSVGLDTALSFAATPDLPQRNEFDLYAGYNVNISRSLALGAVGRIFIRDYYHGDRTDVSELLAVSANWRITRWLTATALTEFAWSDSNHDVFDYEVANIGGAVALTWRF
ncbi:MAG: hypothetical protein ACJ8KU_05850 [Chthoniobacterales bacterium]